MIETGHAITNATLAEPAWELLGILAPEIELWVQDSIDHMDGLYIAIKQTIEEVAARIEGGQ